jgi:MoaA/NifB/PqqE/SkfB family radical SAM enzyme
MANGKQCEEAQFGVTKFEENKRRDFLKHHKPKVYEKVMRFNDKLALGEGVPIIQFQYNYQCNLRCCHCSIEKFQMKRKDERESGRRYFLMDDVRELSRQADEMGLSTIVITGGEPLSFKDFDDLVAAIDPEKFWIVSDTNGWFLDEERARHLKSIGVDKIQLSLDGADSETHDAFRRQKGSWQRAIDAVKACQKADLHIILSTVVWKGRPDSKEFHDFLEMAKDLGVGTYVTYAKPTGAYEGRYDQLVTPEDTDYIRMLEQKYDVFTHMTPSYGMDIGCIAVKRILPITRYGDVLPCPYIPISLGNFFEESLKEIVDRGLNLKWFDPKVKMPCICGEDRYFIDKVMSKTWGDVEVPVRYNKIFTASDYVHPEKEKSLFESGLAPDMKECDDSPSPDGAVEMIMTADGMVPITWAPPDDNRYPHQLDGMPQAPRDEQGNLEIWDAPSNRRERMKQQGETGL